MAESSSRPRVPKAVRDKVLSEFNHRCAICGRDKPQVHHIDGDKSNNDPMNLLPLCPNHHLTDQHNPTGQWDPGIITLFRQYKDPLILSPQFEPLFNRVRFVDRVQDESISNDELRELIDELCQFVMHLKMGEFYGQKMKTFLKFESSMVLYTLDDIQNSQKMAEVAASDREKYVGQVKKNRDEVYRLAVELVRYQEWSPPSL